MLGKKKIKKLTKELEELDKRLYQDTTYISKEEMLAGKLSKRVKAYYNKLTPERQAAFLAYIVRKEEQEHLEYLDGLKIREDSKEDENLYVPKKCKNVAGVIKDIKDRNNHKKQEKKKFKHMIKRKDGLYVILNPESYDHTLLSKKKYRKMLSKVAEKERKHANPVLDCTLKNFREELMDNPQINNAVVDSFYAKYRL